MTGYNPRLSELSRLSLRDLTGLYRVTFPFRPLPVRARTSEPHRDLLMAALLPEKRRRKGAR